MYADRNKFITSNPFANFIMPNLPKLSPIHLTEDEVKKIINRKFDSDRLNHVRDLFLMQCYTGLAFGDLFNFSRTMIEANGESLFIKGNRIKTENEFYLPFMKEAKQIAEKYDYNFRPISNQKFNEYLKEIAILCSIEKKISTHVGRKTFAQKMIDSGYTAESVSKMMGHASFTMTQKHYGRISQERIQKEVLKIAA